MTYQAFNISEYKENQKFDLKAVRKLDHPKTVVNSLEYFKYISC